MNNSYESKNKPQNNHSHKEINDFTLSIKTSGVVYQINLKEILFKLSSLKKKKDAGESIINAYKVQ